MSKPSTPTPWLAVEQENEEEFIIVQEATYQPHFYNPVSEYLSKENADFIVKSANSHEQLVYHLDWALTQITLLDGDVSLFRMTEAQELLAEVKEN